MKNTNQNLDDVLMAFRHAMTTLMLKETKESGFSLQHFEVLRYVAEKGSVTMKDISSWLQITPPSVSALIDILVEKNLLSRVPSKEDRRNINITFGKEFHNLFKKMHKKKDTIFKKMLSRLDSKDKEDLVRIINKCIPN